MNRFWMLIFLLGITACITPSGDNYKNEQDQLMAEHYLMRTNLNLVRRENEVLNEENRQYKIQVQKLFEKITSLNAQLGATQKKYETDMALLQAQYEDLQTRFADFEKQSQAQIQNLSDSNHKLESKLFRNKSRYKQTLQKLKTAFEKERQSLMAGFEAQNQASQKQIDTLTKDLTQKTTDLTTYKNSLSETQAQVTALTEKLQKAQAMIDSLQKIIQDQKNMTEPKKPELQPSTIPAKETPTAN